jgi:hypothetical protein
MHSKTSAWRAFRTAFARQLAFENGLTCGS